MKLSQKCQYALKVILDLSNHVKNDRIHIADIAARQQIPHKYLGQILLQLKRGGFVISKKGPHGGYSLTLPPEAITVGEIIRCIDSRNFANSYDFFGVMSEVKVAIAGVIDRIDFGQIQKRAAEAMAKHDQGHTYFI